MPALTHVCTWQDSEWKRITPQEAARLYPQGVKAIERIFWCELCDQYVLLTKHGRQAVHFRHSSSEENKNCEERVAQTKSKLYQESVLNLPLYIRNVSEGSFSFELAFPRIPEKLLEQVSEIRIFPKSEENYYVYLSERLSYDRTNFLPVGKNPCKSYRIEIEADSDLSEYCPRSTPGVDCGGTLFDAGSGRRLPADSDVEVHKKYYLLRQGELRQKSSHIKITLCLSRKVSWNTWFLYEVCAEDHSLESANFFLNLHYRLTERPIILQPVWPPYIVDGVEIKHNHSLMWVHLRGNISNRFPLDSIEMFPCGNQNQCIFVDCDHIHRRISVGRATALAYLDFWKEPLDSEIPASDIRVLDVAGKSVQEGITEKLPKNRILRFLSNYDGYILQYRKENLVKRIELKADTEIEISNLNYEMDIRVLVGLDMVWQLRFVKPSIFHHEYEATLLFELQHLKGQNIRAPHELQPMVERLQGCPAIQKWLQGRIYSGVIDKRAYKKLCYFILYGYKNNKSSVEV